MAYHHTAPAAMPASASLNQNAARAEHSNHVQCIEERLRNGISPAAVAGITALLAQTVGDPAYLTQFGRINSSRCGGVQTYHDLPEWGMGWV